MGQNASLEGDSSVIVSLSEAAMHMYSAAIDALPFPEDKKFHKRADVVLSGMRKLRAALTEAASSNRPSPAVIVALSGVRQRYDALMAHAAAAPGSSLGQQIYVTRIHAKLSAQEVANGAGLRDGLLDELEAGATPTDDEAAKIRDTIAALGGLPGSDHGPDEVAPVVEFGQHEDNHVNDWDDALLAENAS
ncbi:MULTISPECIES: forkhead-associated protein [Mycolicibacterium]|uniref:Forkhead-associated protein n=1 Tax=Mycolicibacterium wolinskyi TaxID=59750 RepID=A0A132PUL0_9MYCO|nr:MULTISPECIES: forkhead-associated protein [Mycolicibacterium]KWX26003.1 forkhead-associated protein [Mycolicibacterium wolinskyi]MCV7288547.1 XRE family transcriptional regulator [Mycolicibacterium wolinskyi]MCV7295769.1 XRE family transcriptional regulator [Mycolicibacterium goodii]ORX11771.1 forkhead-associated protein [Mycolicibacterium wolinskyi]